MTEGAPFSRPPDALDTPVGRAVGEIRDRGSRFRAIVAPVRDVGGAKAVRDEIRAANHDATHHVWAFRSADGEERWDDDGEPAGTGGRPILAAIEAAALSDVVVVVTRWFGGTRLGTGGLARAYGTAAAEALAEVRRRTVRPGRVLTIRHGWPDTGAVATVLDAFGARRLDERHAGDAEFDVAVAEADAPKLVEAIRESTAGRATTTIRDGRVWVQAEG